MGVEIPIGPIAMHLGDYGLSWFSLLLLLAVVWLIFWMGWRVRPRAGISADTAVNLALVSLASGIIFSRLFHIVDSIVVARLHPQLVAGGEVIDYTQNWVRAFGGQNLSVYGAIFGAALAVWIYCWKAKLPAGRIFDLLAPAAALAQAIGRVGSFLNGESFGTPTEEAWGLIYTNPDSAGYGAGITQPVVVLEIIFCAVMFFLLLRWARRFKADGSLFVVYLGLYAIFRLVTDFLRAGQPFLIGLHQAQVISIIVLLVGIPWLVFKHRTAPPVEIAPVSQSSATGEADSLAG